MWPSVFVYCVPVYLCICVYLELEKMHKTAELRPCLSICSQRKEWQASWRCRWLWNFAKIANALPVFSSGWRHSVLNWKVKGFTSVKGYKFLGSVWVSGSLSNFHIWYYQPVLVSKKMVPVKEGVDRKERFSNGYCPFRGKGGSRRLNPCQVGLVLFLNLK